MSIFRNLDENIKNVEENVEEFEYNVDELLDVFDYGRESSLDSGDYLASSEYKETLQEVSESRRNAGENLGLIGVADFDRLREEEPGYNWDRIQDVSENYLDTLEELNYESESYMEDQDWPEAIYSDGNGFDALKTSLRSMENSNNPGMETVGPDASSSYSPASADD